METLDVLRLILLRDAAEVPALSRWDAGAWEAVHRVVAAWDAAPMVYGALRAARLVEHVPAGIAAAWRKDHTATTAVNLRLAFEAASLAKELAGLGARSAALKGIALFERGVWRDPGSRPTVDVDLLIVPEDGAIVRGVIERRGYVADVWGGSKHWAPFRREGLAVEVHEHAFWSLRDGHRVRLGEMVDAGGKPEVAATVAHLLHHLFESSVTTPWLVVKTLADLAEVRAFAMAEGRGGVAGEVAESARRFGLGRRLGALAGLLELALGRDVPREWTRDQRAGDVEALLGRCVPEGGARGTARRLPDRAAAFVRMPLAEKAALVRYYLLPPADAMRAIYGLRAGSPWVWALYAVRPAHLLLQGALDAARLLMPKAGRDRG